MRLALDTNILAYLAGVDRHPDDARKIEQARLMLQHLRGRATVILPVQVLGELFTVLLKAGINRIRARDAVLEAHRTSGHADSGSATLVSSLDLAATHKLQIWDAMILNAAADAGCSLLLSKDMQHRFAWRDLSIVNPFRMPMDQRLADLIKPPAA